jgi:hypothetical protein
VIEPCNLLSIQEALGSAEKGLIHPTRTSGLG